jgi:hypothetical protein
MRWCRLKLSVGLITIMLSLLIIGGVAAAQGFSADMIMHADKQDMQGKVYIDVGRMRFETGGFIIITRMDQKTVWQLIPSQKLYMEQTFKPQNTVPGAGPAPGEVSRTLLGQETVNGYLCNKYRVTVMTENHQESYLLWLSGSGLPVKVSDEQGKWWQEYKNITVGPQPASLFEIPKGYERFGLSALY